MNCRKGLLLTLSLAATLQIQTIHAEETNCELNAETMLKLAIPAALIVGGYLSKKLIQHHEDEQIRIPEDSPSFKEWERRKLLREFFWFLPLPYEN